MLTLPSFIAPSSIHGYGCYTSQHIEAGALVWVYNHTLDRVLSADPSDWERLHAYGSNASGRLVLPCDNAAWINFAESPNLIEAEELNGEFCLRACREIRACTELTVFPDTDTDYHWKMDRCMKGKDS
jgi:SET domain-containing protein